MTGSASPPDIGRSGSDSRQPWPVALAGACSLLIAGTSARSLFDAQRPLDSFAGRAIGESTMAAVDASGYVGRYVLMLALAGATFLVLAAAFTTLDRSLARRLPARHRLPELSLVLQLGLFAAFALLLDIVARRWAFRPLGEILLGLAFATLGLVWLKGRSSSWSPGPDSLHRHAVALIEQPGTLATALFVPAPAWMFACLIVGAPIAAPGLPLAAGLFLYLGAVAALVWIVTVARRRNGDPAHRSAPFDVGHRFQLAALPVVAAPLALVAANELQYAWPTHGPRALAVTLVSLLAGTMAVLWIGTSDRHRSERLTRWLPAAAKPAAVRRYLLFPLVLASAAALLFHRHELSIGELDYFHLGEQTLPAQQLFHFGKIPLIDLRLAHTFSDVAYQALYALLNGVHELDMLLWQRWMPLVLAPVLIYLVVARITEPRFAFLLTAATPVLSLVSSYYATLLIVPLVWSWTSRRPTVARFSVLWLALATVTAWRIDFGLASAAGVGVLLLLEIPRRREPCWRPLALSVLIVAGAGTAAAVMVGLLTGRPVFGAAITLLDSYSNRLLIRTRPEIIRGYTVGAALQYYLLPAIGVAYVAVIGHLRLVGGRMLEARHRLLGLLAVTSLVISVRSVERHTLIEGFNPYLFYLLIVLLPVFAPRRIARAAVYAACLALLLTRLVITLPPLGWAYGHFERGHLLPMPSLFEFHRWQGDERRVDFDGSRHRELVGFLSQRLGPEQTFFDMTSSPALFVFADRPFPTYVIPNLSQTSERVQQRVIDDLAALHEADRLPFVLLHQNSYWDTMDGVPSEVRSYRIAEWIYDHYRPLGLLGDWEIWEDLRATEEPDDEVQRVQLELGPPTIVNDVTVRLSPQGAVEVEPEGDDPYVGNFVDLAAKPTLGDSLDWWLELTMTSSENGWAQLFWATDGADFSEHSSAYSATRSGAAQVVEADLPDDGSRLTAVRIDPPPGGRISISTATLVGRPARPQPLAGGRVAQRFDLARLPWVWANLDPLDASGTTHTVATVLDRPRTIVPGQSIDLPLPNDTPIGKSTPYLFIRARPLSTTRDSAKPLYMGILFDADRCCGVDLEIVDDDAPGQESEYLVRLATLHRWHSGDVGSLHLSVTAPVELLELSLRGPEPQELQSR